MASPRVIRDDRTDRALRARLQAALGDAYRLGDELGGGGVSRLFLAERLPLRQPVVVKVLAGGGVEARAIRRFRQEAAVTAALRHPHLLPVLAAGEGEALAYFVTPYADGGSLRARLCAGGPLGVTGATRLLQQVAAALAHAHAAGVVHGDLKPENILLHEGRAVLADFGGARLRLGRGQVGWTSGPVYGTPLYMSPEQAAGEVAVDARSDLYSLAVVGYELLTGHAPFTGSTPHEVLLAHLHAPVPSATAARPDVPPALSRVLARAMAKDPAARFSSAAAFRRALAAAAGAGAPTTCSTPSRPATDRRGARGTRGPRLSPPLRRAAALLLTVGVAGAATLGTAHLFAHQFGRTTIAGVTTTALADGPRSTTVPATMHADTMARSIATLPPVVAMAPRPLAARERAGDIHAGDVHASDLHASDLHAGDVHAGDVLAAAASAAPAPAARAATATRSGRASIVRVDAPRLLASLPPEAIAEIERHGARLAASTADAVAARASQIHALDELALDGLVPDELALEDVDALARPTPAGTMPRIRISVDSAREVHAMVRELRIEVERTSRDARRVRATPLPPRAPLVPGAAQESCPSARANGTA